MNQATESSKGARKKTLFASLIFIFVLALFYRDVVFGGRTFLSLQTTAGTMPYLTSGGSSYDYPGDKDSYSGAPMDVGTVAWLKEPDQYYSRKLFQQGELPLWVPNQGLGQPHNASGLSGVWDPINILTYFSSDSFWPYAVDFEMLLRYLLAGLFTYLFLIELGLSFEAACFGGIAFMLSAFFSTFGGHQLIRVQTLLPMLLYTFEIMFKKPSVKTATAAILTILWCLVADFPEASLIILMLASLWYATRLFSDFSNHEDSKKRILFFISAVGISMLLSGPWLLPFVENMQNHSAHEEGSHVGMSSIPGNHLFDLFLTKRLPMHELAGMFSPILVGLSLICAFALTTLKRQKLAILFFTAFFAVWFTKLFNYPITAWLGKLPLIEQTLLTRELEPPLAFCLAVLAAHGLHVCLESSLTLRRILYSFLATVLLFGVFAKTSDWQGIKASDLLSQHYTRNIYVFLFEMSVPFIIIFAIRSFKQKKVLLLTALTMTIFFSGTVRELKLRCLRHHPYKEPPFVSFVKAQDNPDTARIFAYDMMVYPNIAQAHEVNDLRYISALDSERRKEFVDNFLAQRHETLRLTGNEPKIYLGRYFDLCGVDYILTPFAPDFHTSIDPVDHFWKNTHVVKNRNNDRLDLLERIAAKKQTVLFPLIATDSYTIDGKKRDAIFLHPPNTAACSVTIPDTSAKLHFAVGMDPKCYDLVGDGATFKVTLIDTSGNKTQLFSQYIDPKENTQYRRWFVEAIDLSSWSKQTVQLQFSTDGGPANDTSADWALWSRPYIEGKGIADANYSKLQLVSSEKVHIFRNTSAFPKAFVVFNAIHVPGIEEAVEVMKHSDLDPSRTAVIDGKIPEDVKSILVDKTHSANAPDPVAATVTERTANRLKVNVSIDKPGLLVVSENHWRGWRVFVDGQKAPIIPAYLMMRSVFVDQGEHEIEFIYFPTTLKLGLVLMLGGISILGFWWWRASKT